jgi:S1-C subfamily serine protease
MGIVSALGRALPTDNDAYQDYIQTDASINPGNSGGALLDLQGRIAGINTAILSQSGGNIGIGFAIPINLANAIMHQLIEHGEVRRGQLGIMVQDLTPDLARYLKLDIQQGAIVAQVTPGSAAEQAGLRSEDVIVAVNDKPVRGARELRNVIGLMTIGDTVKLKVLRDGDTKTITAKIGKKQEQKLKASGELHPALAGATLAPGAGRNDERGLVVQSLDPNSPAAYSGLQEKDLIVEVNRQPVKTLDDLAKAVKAGDGALLLKIRRGSATLLLFLR